MTQFIRHIPQIAPLFWQGSFQTERREIWRYQFFSGDEEVAAISVKNLPHYDEWSIGIGGSEFTILSSEETIREEFLRWFDPTEVETKFNAAYEEFFRQRD